MPNDWALTNSYLRQPARPANCCSGVAGSARLVTGQPLKFHLELFKCLVMEIDHFEKLNERQFDILFDDLVSQRFERTMNNAFGFGEQSGCFGDIRVCGGHIADPTTNSTPHPSRVRYSWETRALEVERCIGVSEYRGGPRTRARARLARKSHAEVAATRVLRARRARARRRERETGCKQLPSKNLY